jgi:hypothetical protein
LLSMNSRKEKLRTRMARALPNLRMRFARGRPLGTLTYGKESKILEGDTSI